MGKNLKGKECGKGICQRKDGLYYARFVDKTGKRHEKYLPTLPEARNWIEESKYANAHEDVFVATDTTVDQWLDFWIENIVGDLAPNTLRNYRERYVHNIQPVMGKMMIRVVREKGNLIMGTPVNKTSTQASIALRARIIPPNKRPLARKFGGI